MEVIRNLRHLKRDNTAIITVGTFDGIHIGHQQLIAKVIEDAKLSMGKSTLVTFSPHPKVILLQPNAKPIKLLSSDDEKIELLKKLGLDKLIIIRFTKQFANLASEDFFVNILIKKIGFKQIVVGHDHAFGRDREGSIDLLKQLATRYDYRVECMDAVSLDGHIVSSTFIRQQLSRGEIETANRFLGRPYTLSGRVVAGDGRGRSLSFPTANIQPLARNKLIPPDGIYAVKINLGDKTYSGAMSIGVRPTFSKNKRTIEAFILNFNGNLYDQILNLHVLKRLRDEKKFDTTELLIHQMKADIKQIEQEFGT
ncbi:bifunctional riboflavin kinase/FAD synthetase [candidate division KSB1 bacterium]|nr:bifunctional riboflavin kinase/FAD synthetase [candidate division KSB1 bacterium]